MDERRGRERERTEREIVARNEFLITFSIPFHVHVVKQIKMKLINTKLQQFDYTHTHTHYAFVIADTATNLWQKNVITASAVVCCSNIVRHLNWAKK